MQEYTFDYQHLDANSLKADWKKLRDAISKIADVKITTIQKLEVFIDTLNEYDILVTDLDMGNYIASMQNTKDDLVKAKQQEIEDHILPLFKTQKKLAATKILSSTYLEELLQKSPEYLLFKQQLEAKVDRENNATEDQLSGMITKKIMEYNDELAKMTVHIDGHDLYTVIAFMTKLKDKDRDQRKRKYEQIIQKEDEFTDIFNDLFDELLKLRTAQAKADAYSNYRDWNWQYKNCTDYTPEDVAHFCDAIKEVFIPIQRGFTEMRKQELDLEQIMPWDTTVDMFSLKESTYFKSVEDLKTKASELFKKIHPDFQSFFQLLEEKKHLDFEVRDHKSPAMFSFNLPEKGIPFVYLLAVNNIQGITSVIHECTHAFHSLYNLDKKHLWQKRPKTEANELFPLSMELLSMEYWDIFFESEIDLLAAKLKKLENCLKIFRMVGLWDCFQTWVYLNPDHTRPERDAYWLSLLKDYDIGLGISEKDATSWQKRPLIFRAPFYMIEYGIASLGALTIYKNYKTDKKKTIHQFIQAMQLGNTVPMKEIFETAGVTFDFSRAKTEEAGLFLETEINNLYKKIQEIVEAKNGILM